MAEAKFNIDPIDRDIIDLLQEDPHLTHMEIAKKVSRSQPTIGMRISKLEDKGLLEVQRGANFKKVPDLFLSTVTLNTKDPDAIFKQAEHCPFILNCFKISGDNNILLLLTSSDKGKLDNMVNYHFRLNEKVSNVKMEFVVDIAKDLILPVDFRSEDHSPDRDYGCGDHCIKHIKQIQLEKEDE